jgi:hypothetical protein
VAERAQHNNAKDKGKFGQGKKEAPRKTAKPAAKSTAKTREATRSKGGRRERED